MIIKDRTRQILNVVLGITQLITNGINGENVARVSDSYSTFFTPAGYTFAVWAPIYLGISAYAIYQALPSQTSREIHRKIGWWAVLAAAMNAIWTPLFVIEQIALSVPVMLVLLFSLAAIFVQLRRMRGQFTQADRWAVQIPFSGYFAWINVATIANLTVFLIEMNWGAFGIDGALWSVVAILAALVITGSMIMYSMGSAGTIAYLAVLVWALVGVYVGNVDQSVMVGNVALGTAALLVLATIVRFVRNGGPSPAAERRAAAR